MSSLIELFGVYVNDARAFALLHLLFIIAYFSIRFADLKFAYFWRRYSEPCLRQKHSTIIADLTSNVCSLAEKGYMSDAQSVVKKLSDLLSSRDGIVNNLLNGIIIIGLLGTLFNLWRLGPGFWSLLLQDPENTRQPAIGIAFAASFFGLLWAVILSLLDSIVVRLPREDFIRASTTQVLQQVIEKLPFSREKTIADSMNNLIESSKAVEANMHRRLEAFTLALVTQARSSATLLNDGFVGVTANWKDFLEEAQGKIDGQVKQLEASTGQLTTAINETRDHLAQCGNLGDILVNVQHTSEQLVSRIGVKLGEVSRQTQNTVSAFVKDVEQRLERETELAGRRLTQSAYLQSELLNNWHRSNKEALSRFSASLEKTGGVIEQAGGTLQQDSQRFTQSLREQVDHLTTDWKDPLNNFTNELKTSLQEILKVLQQMEASSEKLAHSTATVSSNISELQEVVRVASAIPSQSDGLKSELVGISASLRLIEAHLKKAPTPAIRTGTKLKPYARSKPTLKPEPIITAEPEINPKINPMPDEGTDLTVNPQSETKEDEAKLVGLELKNVEGSKAEGLKTEAPRVEVQQIDTASLPVEEPEEKADSQQVLESQVHISDEAAPPVQHAHVIFSGQLKEDSIYSRLRDALIPDWRVGKWFRRNKEERNDD